MAHYTEEREAALNGTIGDTVEVFAWPQPKTYRIVAVCEDLSKPTNREILVVNDAGTPSYTRCGRHGRDMRAYIGRDFTVQSLANEIWGQYPDQRVTF